MENEQIKTLKAEIALLKGKFQVLDDCYVQMTEATTVDIVNIKNRLKNLEEKYITFDKDSEKNTVDNIYQHLANLHDIVSPIEDKVFPGIHKTRKQIKQIVGPKRLGDGKDLDKRKQ